MTLDNRRCSILNRHENLHWASLQYMVRRASSDRDRRNGVGAGLLRAGDPRRIAPAAADLHGVGTIAHAITDRKQAEADSRELDLLPYVASLAAAAAHEINNPLAVVVGQAQLLAEEVDAAGRRRIEEIFEATRRIQAILDRLKRIHRLELSDAREPVPEMLDIEKSSS